MFLQHITKSCSLASWIMIETQPIIVFPIFSQICQWIYRCGSPNAYSWQFWLYRPLRKSSMIHRSAMASCMSQCSPVRKLSGNREIAIRIERSLPSLTSLQFLSWRSSEIGKIACKMERLLPELSPSLDGYLSYIARALHAIGGTTGMPNSVIERYVQNWIYGWFRYLRLNKQKKYNLNIVVTNNCSIFIITSVLALVKLIPLSNFASIKALTEIYHHSVAIRS